MKLDNIDQIHIKLEKDFLSFVAYLNNILSVNICFF